MINEKGALNLAFEINALIDAALVDNLIQTCFLNIERHRVLPGVSQLNR